MNPPLDLAPYMVRPGARVICAEVESNRSRKVWAQGETERLRRCRAAFEGHSA